MAENTSEKEAEKPLPEKDLIEENSRMQKAAEAPVPIVGIGASAGGLQALEDFFSHLPEDSGIAFAVISHTDPTQTSLLPEIIRRKTKARVVLVEDGVLPEPDAIYFPPSDKDLVIVKGVFHLIELEKRDGLHMPIDIFLKSLSEDRGELCGCVILSGTGTDGAHGLRMIKENAGVAAAQSKESARHPGMPQSAIATGLVDFILNPSEMPARLIRYFRDPEGSRDAGIEEDIRASMEKILSFLSKRTKHDFSFYKKSTLIRRIARRIKVTGSKEGSAYFSYLRHNPEETELLFNDLLIGVTGFFRDPDAFSYLQEEVLPGLIYRRPAGEAFRVWIPGCATGEEAYSVSIILNEVMADPDLKREVQIFATDIAGHAIEKAREGVYLKNIATDLSHERLKRFFVKEGEFYRVRKEIREPVVFAVQNVLGNPPFSRLDLLVCRNLMIYLEGEAQKKLIPLFHYTLRPEGVLFLGTSESIGRFSDLFSPIHKKWSIYRKQDAPARPAVEFPTTGWVAEKITRNLDTAGSNQHPERPGLGRIVESLLLKEHTPPCVIVNRSEKVLYIHGRTGKYLGPPQGEASLRITDMAREGLQIPLSAALREASSSGREVKRRVISVKTNGGYQKIGFTVRPLTDSPALKDALLILFEDVAPAGAPGDAKKKRKSGGDDAAEQVLALERDLARVREDYRSATEELRTSNEVLKSVNEEIQSANEELQSSNEELESSREELHSLNEELSTVNSELHNKIEELSSAYSTITDVLNSTRIAILFLDKEMKVKRFTDEASHVMNLIKSDIGRPFHHIAPNFEYGDFARRVREVMDRLDSFGDEVRTKDGHWYHMRIMPYRTHQGKIDGIVLTFINIDLFKENQAGSEKTGSRGKNQRGEKK